MADSAQDLDLLLADVKARPTDGEARERAARVLTGAGRAQDAVALLGEGLRNLTAHADAALPCLCKRCLDPALASAEVSGERFLRDFTVARGRVLYFWVPAGVAGEADAIRRAVHARLDVKLATSDKKRRKRRR